MLIIMSSPDAILRNGVPYQELVQVLAKAKDQGNPVGVISNHTEPSWFSDFFSGTEVQFLRIPGRQNGKIVSHNANHYSLKPHDVLVLAAKPADIQMGKNGGAILITAGWSQNPQVVDLGIHVDSSGEFYEVVSFISKWPGGWWFVGDATNYSVRVVADLSGYGVSNAQRLFGHKLTSTVKNGGARLKALLAVTTRSLLVDGLGLEQNLVWGVYPSSNSRNDDGEVLSDFLHRLRTTVSRVRYASRGEPLFIRHQPSPKRSAGNGEDREDPSSQITTIHLNPFYRERGRLQNKRVIVLDDCTTYGVSFGVASAFLRRAGAAAVTNVALGKFGSRSEYYDITIDSDPFSPIEPHRFTFRKANLTGYTNSVLQHQLQEIIP